MKHDSDFSVDEHEELVKQTQRATQGFVDLHIHTFLKKFR
jgi:hypothetical protein